jgi:DNA-binding CsgD family transcriptional regulator
MKPSPKLLHAAIARSSLTRAQKAVARLVCRIPSDRMSYGLGTVAERLDITERTVRSAIRELERLGVLTLVHRERNGTMPRVYSISRDAIMSIPCAESDPQGGKKGGPEGGKKGGPEGGNFSGVPYLAEIFRPEFPRITTPPLEDVREAAEQPPTRESRSNVIPFPSKPRGTRAESLQGQAAYRAAGSAE